MDCLRLFAFVIVLCCGGVDLITEIIFVPT